MRSDRLGNVSAASQWPGGLAYTDRAGGDVLELRVLGQFDVRLDGVPVTVPSRPAQSLLAYLALTAGTAHRREHLAGLFWPDAAEDSARSSLRQALWRIRRAIEAELPAGAHYLLADDFSVAFDAAAAYWLDAAVLDRADDGGVPIADLAVYRGELLPGFYDEWVAPERARLEAAFERRIGHLLDGLVAERRWLEVLEWAERWIAVGHAPEPAYRALMLAHSELGDRARVAASYRRCREALLEELGVEPSEQTRTLYARLAHHRPLVPPAPERVPHAAAQLSGAEDEAPPAPGKAPFQGLRAFDEGDADRFFGREGITARLLERLRAEHFLAVVGASGSGKSSVVRAGLLPALRRARSATGRARPEGEPATWHVHVLTPTAHPIDALAASLATPALAGAVARLSENFGREPRALRLHLLRTLPRGARALLVVDQLEELFTLCLDVYEREAFVDSLLGACGVGGPATVVVAIRADFYAHCAQYPALREAVARHQEYLGPMGSEELRRAIEGPAHTQGWELEPGLVDVLLREVGDEPGALPLLSHALLETWCRRRGRLLTLRGYAESGGVRSAIAQTAERLYGEQLAPQQQVIARRIFVRLTELGEGTQDTRRRARLDELVAGPGDVAAVHAVLQALADARLITLGEDSADVAHEALIREWPTLRSWLDEDRAGLRLHRQLSQAALDWERLGREPDVLYRGVRLAQAREWAHEHGPDLSALEQAFVLASIDQAERESAAREAQRQRELAAARELAQVEQRRSEEQGRAAGQLRRRARLLAGASALAVVLAVAALFFGDQARHSSVSAQANALAAEANARIATARELAAASVSNLQVDPERSLLLALRAVAVTYAVDRTWVPEANNALHRAVLASRARLTLAGHTGPVSALAVSSDGAHLATVGEDGSVKVWDAATGHELRTVAGQAGGPGGVAFSPDGSRFAAAAADNTVPLWDVATGQRLLTLTGHTGAVHGVIFSPDGGHVATLGDDGTVRLWDAATGAPLRTLQGADLRGLAFSPDGQRLLTSEGSGAVNLWDAGPAAASTPLLSLHVEHPGWSSTSGGTRNVAFAPDGQRIAAIGTTDLTVWDVSRGSVVLRLEGTNDKLTSVAFSPDGARLATGGLDQKVTLWDAATGRLLFQLAGHTAAVTDLAFTPDGMHLASAGEDGVAKVWDLGPSRELLLLSTPGSLGRVTFDPTGQRLAVGFIERKATVWDATTGQQLVTVGTPGPGVLAAVFSPDGARLAAGGGDGAVWVWDAASGQVLHTLVGHQDGLNDVAFSPEGRHLASASQDGTARIWDLQDPGRPPVTVAVPPFGPTRVAFSPDGRRLATASTNGMAQIWEATTGEQLLELQAHRDAALGLAFSPDGRRLVTSGGAGDATARIWDAATGQPLLVLRGHTGTVMTARFSPDGRRVATASRDGTARVWDAETGQEVLALPGDGTPLGGVAFSPDGRRLAVGADDAIRVYALRIEDLVELAQTRLTRSWTAEECQRFLHLEQCPG